MIEQTSGLGKLNLERRIDVKSSSTSATEKFSDSLFKAINEVNAAQLNADQKIENLVTGKDKNIHGTMIAMEKAEISTKLFLAVRNKVMSAYQEVMRMPV